MFDVTELYNSVCNSQSVLTASVKRYLHIYTRANWQLKDIITKDLETR